MKLWLLLLLLLGIAPAQAQGIGGQPLYCNQWAQAAVAVGTTQLVAGVPATPNTPAKIISVCGFVFSSTSAATGQIVAGTGSNCATNQTNVSAVWNITGAQPTGLLNGNATVALPPGTALCATIGTTTTNVQVIYTQN